MLRRWRKFRQLAANERRILLRAFIALPVTELGLRALGFYRFQALLAKNTRKSRTTAQSQFQQDARLAARMVRAASREGWVRGNCLSQSLTLWWMLRRSGIPAEVHIGAMRSPSGLYAHAWVESGGAILNDSEDVHRRYAPFDQPISPIRTAQR